MNPFKRYGEAKSELRRVQQVAKMTSEIGRLSTFNFVCSHVPEFNICYAGDLEHIFKRKP